MVNVLMNSWSSRNVPRTRLAKQAMLNDYVLMLGSSCYVAKHHFWLTNPVTTSPEYISCQLKSLTDFCTPDL
jgi:hypothetical protein